MSDRTNLSPRELLELEKARLLAEAAAKQAAAKEAEDQAAAIDSDMAELDRLTAKYNLVLATRGADAPNHAPTADSMSVGALIAAYKAHPDSQYRKIRHRTRGNYDSLLKRMNNDCGNEKLAGLKAPDVQRIYDRWAEGGKIPMAHSLITMFRSIVSFGVSVLESRECERLSYVLHKMQFSMPRAKKEQEMTEVYATRVRNTARVMKLPSIALAQAFQWDCKLLQTDVIGQWVPLSEPGNPSEVIDRESGLKWLWGIRWERIDEKLILRHVTSARQESVEKDLNLCPMVRAELEAAYCKHGAPLTRDRLPARGPIIINEDTGVPYLTHTFRRRWRAVAKEARVPNDVKNRASGARERPQTDETKDKAGQRLNA